MPTHPVSPPRISRPRMSPPRPPVRTAPPRLRRTTSLAPVTDLLTLLALLAPAILFLLAR